MKLSEYRNEDALDLLADLIDPAAVIFGDPEVRKAVEKKEKKTVIIKKLIKNHKPEVIEILARLDGCEPEKYEVNVLTLPAKLLEIFNDKDLIDLFQSQGQKMGVN